MRPAELPEPDKKAPTPVTAAAALCGDDHQPSVPALHVAAIAARMREAAPAVQGQRRGIVRVRAVQDPNAADTLALRCCAGCQCQTRRSGSPAALCDVFSFLCFLKLIVEIRGRRARRGPARGLFGHGWDAPG